MGHRTLWADGSSVSMADTPELHEHCGHPGGQKPGCGFPVAHLMALLHAGTGMVLKMLSAPLRTHDLSHVVHSHPALQPDDVLGTDRGMCSYAHLALLARRGVHAVFRMHQQHLGDFTPGRPHLEPGTRSPTGKTGVPRSRWLRKLGKHDQGVDWRKPTPCPEWRGAQQYAQRPESLEGRALRTQVQQNGLRVDTITLVTTLVDADCSSLEAGAALFLARWGIATNVGHVTTTMGLDVLTCKTVDGVRKELMVFGVMYHRVRFVMGQAARRQQVAIARISFIDALRWLTSAHEGEPLPTRIVNPHRPSRDEPRVRKRRPQPYPLMTKPRQELRNSLAEKRVMR